MNFVLFDDITRNNLLPLTFTKPVADLRIGILTIREKWEFYLQAKTSTLTEDYLREKYPLEGTGDTILINGSILPDPLLVEKILSLKKEEALVREDCIIAQYIDMDNLKESEELDGIIEKTVNWEQPLTKINYPWDIFTLNHQAIENDFQLIIRDEPSRSPEYGTQIIGNGKLFIHPTAKVYASTLNTATGPVYIGKNTEIMEGANIRGPFALCEGATVKMGAKIYGATTIGMFSKVGGELNNVVFGNYSNKAHDGFLGNSVIGDWCNIGADTNSSNLKNTYDTVRMWNYPSQSFISTGLQFCGMVMGDHSKCGINTMFNTGTVIGVNANIFGSGFQRNFIASFTWGGTSGFTHYDIEKAIEVATAVYKRRGLEFTKTEEKILRHIFHLTRQNRRF